MALAKIMSFINPILLASPQHGPSLADSLSFLLIVPSLFQLLEFHFTASCWLFQSLIKPQPMSSPTSLYPPLFYFTSVSFLSSKLLPSHQKPTSNIHSFPQFSLRAAKIHYSMMCVPTYILSLKAIFLYNRHF